MASKYGKLPTEVMALPAGQFWRNAKIRQAGVAWEQKQRDMNRNNQTSAGAATEQEKERLVKANESRADAREAADGSAPDFRDQLEQAGGI